MPEDGEAHLENLQGVNVAADVAVQFAGGGMSRREVEETGELRIQRGVASRVESSHD